MKNANDTFLQIFLLYPCATIRQTADVFFQPQLVDGSDLLCKGGRIVFEQFRYLYLYMSGELFLANSTACDGDNHYDGAVSVADVI